MPYYYFPWGLLWIRKELLWNKIYYLLYNKNRFWIRYQIYKLNKIFLFDCGRIISIFYRDRNSELEQREYAYIHLQKRKMSNNTDNFDKYFITYKSMENYEEINDKITFFYIWYP